MDITIKNVPYQDINPNSNLIWVISQGIKISDINIRYDNFCYEISITKNGVCTLLDRFKCTEVELHSPNDWYFKFVRFQIWLDSDHFDFLINEAEKNYLLKIWDLIPKDQRRNSILMKTNHDLFIESNNFQYHTLISNKSYINLINGYNYSLYSLLFDDLKKTYEIKDNKPEENKDN